MATFVVAQYPTLSPDDGDETVALRARGSRGSFPLSPKCFLVTMLQSIKPSTSYKRLRYTKELDHDGVKGVK